MIKPNAKQTPVRISVCYVYHYNFEYMHIRQFLGKNMQSFKVSPLSAANLR